MIDSFHISVVHYSVAPIYFVFDFSRKEFMCITTPLDSSELSITLRRWLYQQTVIRSWTDTKEHLVLMSV